MKTILSVILSVIGFILFCWLWWFIGGINLAEIKQTSIVKAHEICGGSQIVVQGYDRRIFRGFGGAIWYQCSISNVWYVFSVSRRVNNSELQVYNFEQKSTFPNNFTLKNTNK